MTGRSEKRAAMRVTRWFSVFHNRRMAAVLLLGFTSGLPFALLLSPLQAWMKTAHIDLKTIGIFSLVGLPYTLKFLWAPVMDRYTPPFFGRRRGWILVCQVLLAGSLGLLSLIAPATHTLLLAATALGIGFFSASQDIVINAYQTEVLPPVERGAGAAVYVFGYRIAMLVAGALGLMLADHLGWPATYRLMALLMLGCAGFTGFCPEPAAAAAPRSLGQAVVAPLLSFMQRQGALWLLLLVVLYKLADAFATALNTPFFLEQGFSQTEIGAITKVGGLIAMILGGLLGGGLLARIGLFRSLLIFGLVQALAILPFFWLACAGHSYPALVVAVCAENFGSGMGTTAFVAFLMALCDSGYSATQYALLSALAALGRVLLGPAAGSLASHVGWPMYFTVSALLAVPGLLLLVVLRQTVQTIDLAGDTASR